jgi:hypothetical protein
MSNYAIGIEIEGNSIKSLKQIEGELGNLTNKSKETHDKITEHFSSLSKEIGSSLKTLAVGGLGIGALFGIGEFAKSSLEAFDQYEEGVTKVEAALKSTGEAAGRSIEQLKESVKN